MRPAVRAAAVAAVALLLVGGASRSANQASDGETTISGEVVNLNCYLTDAKKKGSAHEACAREGIGTGDPVGILTRTGEIYLVIGRDAKWIMANFSRHAGKQVTVTGILVSRGRIQAVLAASVTEAK